MKRSRLTAVLLVLAAGCASQQPEGKPTAAAPPPEERQRITNIAHFDLINCKSPSFEITPPLTKEALIGLLVAARPQVLECLADPKARGPAENTKFTVETTVSEGTWRHQTSGANLAQEGEACVKATIDLFLEKSLSRVVDAKAKPVTATVAYEQSGYTPALRWGVNEASDLVGKIRLEEKAWCECFEPWKGKAPYQMRAKVVVDPKEETQVQFEASSDPAAAAVQGCLKNKIVGMRLRAKSSPLGIPYPFILLNSSVSDELPDARLDVRFNQLDGQRTQVSANTAIAIGLRNNAIETYDASVKKFNAKRQSSMVRTLKEQCADLVKADDGWIRALERQLTIELRTAELTASLRAQDASWADADEASHKAASLARSDLEMARKAKVADAAICPKER